MQLPVPETPSDPNSEPRTADEWVARRALPNRTSEEDAAFKQWLAADPSRANEYEVCEAFSKIHKFLLRFHPDIALQAFAEAIDRKQEAATEIPPVRRMGPFDHAARKWVQAAVIAGIVAALALGFIS